MIDALWNDVRYALRSWTKAPAFAFLVLPRKR
jgi:hypothetical protein